ncbi:hypothetical protein TNCV_4810701 [Trichonephila clavipes]|nr:hypothetical protein TNCV_4810701 [Trichonephila clavipes]
MSSVRATSDVFKVLWFTQGRRCGYSVLTCFQHCTPLLKYDRLLLDRGAWTYSIHREENMRELMNLKLTYVLNLFAADSRAIVGHYIKAGIRSCGRVECGMVSK